LTTDTSIYDNANRVQSVNGVTYTFDANGNLKNDGVNDYAYDSANRLKSLNGTTYSYNGLGDRLTQNGVHYTLDLNTGLTQVLSDGTNTYTYGVGRISQTNTSTEYFLGDALGSVRQLTNASGAVTYAKAYDPYGVVTSTNGASQSAYGYTGEQQSNDMVYLRSRYYASNTGRFLTRDTWGGDANSPMSYNKWLYTFGNPVKYKDPSGLFPLNVIENNIPVTKFAIDPSPTFSIQRSRWGFLAALREAKDYDYIRVGSLDLISLYPKLAVSKTEMIWSINCDLIMVGGQRLSDYYENEVRKQRMPLIYWRDTSARYYDLFRPSEFFSKTFVDGGDLVDYPQYRSVSLGLGIVELNLLADVNGQIHLSVSGGPGAIIGLGYTEGYLCNNISNSCSGDYVSPFFNVQDELSLSDISNALNGTCVGGNIQILTGGAGSICPTSTNFDGFSGIWTYYLGAEVGLGAGVSRTISLPYRNPLLGWSWAVNNQLNGWNIDSAYLNYH